MHSSVKSRSLAIIICTASLSINAENSVALKTQEPQIIPPSNEIAFALSNSKTEIFGGLILGKSTAEDISKISKTRINLKDHGSLGGELLSSSPLTPNKPNIKFAEFSIEDQYLQGTFYQGILIAIRVYKNSLIDELDESLIIDLRQNFNKKYNRTAQKTELHNDKIANRTYIKEIWTEHENGFIFEIITRRKVVKNVQLCNSLADSFRGISGAASLRWDCTKATDNKPIYTLNYYYSPGFEAALADLKKFKEMEKIQEDQKEKKRLSSF